MVCMSTFFWHLASDIWLLDVRILSSPLLSANSCVLQCPLPLLWPTRVQSFLKFTKVSTMWLSSAYACFITVWNGMECVLGSSVEHKQLVFFLNSLNHFYSSEPFDPSSFVFYGSQMAYLLYLLRCIAFSRIPTSILKVLSSQGIKSWLFNIISQCITCCILRKYS